MATPTTTFAERMKELLEVKNLSQAELGRKCDISKATISRYVAGQFEAKADCLARIADATNVNEAWLMGYDVPMERTRPSGVSFYSVPLDDVSCGNGIMTHHSTETALCPNSVRADHAVRCHGDSMIGDGIQDGDIVYIRYTEEVPSDGSICAVVYEDEALVKHIYRIGDMLQLVSSNGSYAPITIMGDEAQRAKIIGTAVGLFRPL